MPALPLTCGRHGWDGGPWAFPRASHPTDQEPATHVAVGTGRTQTWNYVFDMCRTSLTSSLITRDLVSQKGGSLPRLRTSRVRRPPTAVVFVRLSSCLAVTPCVPTSGRRRPLTCATRCTLRWR